ncbi:twin-arginine translocation signal domain-containing protein, partial [Eggerthella lenta]
MGEHVSVTRRTLLQASAAGTCALVLGGVAAS